MERILLPKLKKQETDTQLRSNLIDMEDVHFLENKEVKRGCSQQSILRKSGFQVYVFRA